MTEKISELMPEIAIIREVMMEQVEASSLNNDLIGAEMLNADLEANVLRYKAEVARLTGLLDKEITPEGYDFISTKPEMSKYITALRAENERLREALEKIAETDVSGNNYKNTRFQCEQIARAALQSKGE